MRFVYWFVKEHGKSFVKEVKDFQLLIAVLVLSAALYFGLQEMKPTTEFDACINSLMSIPDFNYTSQQELAFRMACSPYGSR